MKFLAYDRGYKNVQDFLPNQNKGKVYKLTKTH